MNSELTFRLLIGVAVPVIVGARVWVTVERPFDPYDGSRLQPLAALLLGLIADSVAVVFTLEYLAVPGLLDFSHSLMYPVWLRAVGAVLLLVGVVLLLWSTVHLDRRTQADTGPAGEEYPRSGPYRWVRHPVYAAILLQYIGVGLVSSSWVLTFIPPVLYLGALSRLIPKEERLIRDSLGHQQSTYVQRTGMFLPMMDHMRELLPPADGEGEAFTEDSDPS